MDLDKISDMLERAIKRLAIFICIYIVVLFVMNEMFG